MRLGLVADTHGYLGDDTMAALAGVDMVLHAGDVGDGVLGRLASVAPVVAVRGNNDTTGEAAALPGAAGIDTPAGLLVVVHRLVDAPAEGYDVLVFGHCHRPHAYEKSGRFYANPGAAGRRGFHQERSVAVLEFEGRTPRVTFVPLGPRRAAP